MFMTNQNRTIVCEIHVHRIEIEKPSEFTESFYVIFFCSTVNLLLTKAKKSKNRNLKLELFSIKSL